MIETVNYDGKAISVMVARIITVTAISSDTCNIHLDTGDVVFAQDSSKVIVARVNKYLADYRPFAIQV